MASKYDIYWLSIMGGIHNGILDAMNKNRRVDIDVRNITAYGKRNSWYGAVEVSSEGIKGGEMSHAMSLGKIIMEQDFLKDMNDRTIKFKISNSLELEIEVVSEKSVKKEIIQVPPPNKHKPFDKIITTPQSLIESIYSLLEKLPMFDYSYEPKNLPKNGIYFFYEDGEKCDINGVITDRIVRVGTHQADNRFRDRIRNHYRGDKNSSVFRTHVGSAIINRNKTLSININEWMKHMTPTINDIEELINEAFKEKFKFRCISVQSKDERLYIEERLITTLSHWNFSPSNHWLGHFAERKEIRSSGLWNVQHIDGQNIMNEQDLTILKEKINSLTLLNKYSLLANKDKESGTKQNKVICFIPCCKRKDASGNIIKPEHILSIKDLPNTWDDLLEGRKGMQYCIEHISPKTSAINLYNGKLYGPLAQCKTKIIELIHTGQLRLIIISAGYGIIDALELIHNYDEMMKGKVASHWRSANLTNVIADLLLQEKPTRVYGFFAGESFWSTPGSKYRYFFAEGVKIALRKGLGTELNGCFYRIEGGGFPSFEELRSLGNTFIDLMKSHFNDSYVKNIRENGRHDGNVKIGFDEISI